MKKTTAYITLALLLLALLGGCKSNTAKPSASPNVPAVSQSPAIPSPSVSASPKASAAPSASPKASASPAASPSASK